MSAFRDFELGRWADPSVCQAYHDQLGGLITQAIAPLLDAAKVGPRVSVLDVATGVGVVAASAAGRGASVVGIDFSAEQLRRARERHPDLTFEPGEADALPFGPSSFDAVVSNFGVPHFPDPEKFIRDALRVVRPAGWLAFTVWAAPDRTKVYGAIMHAVERFGSFEVGLPPGPDVFRYADPATARDNVEAGGFEAVSITTVPQVWKLRAADDAFLGILGGTARTSALLQRQTPKALDQIRSAVREAMAAYRTELDEYLVPMPAVLVAGRKPSTPTRGGTT